MRPLSERLLYPLEAAGALLLYGLVAMLPIATASAVGAWLLRRIGPLLPPHRTARGNLERAFPDADRAEIDRILDGMWANLGRTASEFPRLHRLAVGDGGAIEVAGGEIAERIAAEGGPAIFFSAHIANWEVMPIVASHYGIPVDLIFRTPNNPWIARLLERRTRVSSGALIPKGPDGAKQAYRTLKSGRCLGMLVDQKLNDGIEATFFGQPAMTAHAFAQLALRLGCPLIPIRIERLGGPRFRVTVEPPIPHPASGDRATDVQELVQAVNDRLETWIRAHPEQWFWVHRRWKKRAEGGITGTAAASA